MYENIIKILDKSKNAKVDILVARDMVIKEENIPYDEIKKASDFISDYYDTITKCRRLGDNDTIKTLVAADDKGRKEIIKKVADINE